MKPTAQLLGVLLAALSVTVLADDKPAAPAAKPAPAVAASTPATAAPNQFLIPGLPAYSPPPPVEAQPAQAPNPDVLELPKMVVKQKPRPRLTPEIMVTKKAFGEDLAKQKFSGLDQALNKFTIPLFGTSMADRALEDYEREKREQMTKDTAVISKALETVDPAEAKSLKDAATKP